MNYVDGKKKTQTNQQQFKNTQPISTCKMTNRWWTHGAKQVLWEIFFYCHWPLRSIKMFSICFSWVRHFTHEMPTLIFSIVLMDADGQKYDNSVFVLAFEVGTTRWGTFAIKKKFWNSLRKLQIKNLYEDAKKEEMQSERVRKREEKKETERDKQEPEVNLARKRTKRKRCSVDCTLTIWRQFFTRIYSHTEINNENVCSCHLYVCR